MTWISMALAAGAALTIRPADNTIGVRNLARLHAAAILQRVRLGSILLINPARDMPRLKKALSANDVSGAFPARLLQVVDRLSARSTRQAPLTILGLYRANSGVHSAGRAIDIAAFGGDLIDSRTPDRGLPGILRLISALGPGEYSLGLPKPPDSDPIPLLPPPKTVTGWPYFPAPLPELVFASGRLVVAPEVRNGRMIPGPRGRLAPRVLRWANERGAPRNDLGSRELRNALAAAESRGIRFRSFFPDALDHVHLDVH